jgi:hypothetical protein
VKIGRGNAPAGPRPTPPAVTADRRPVRAAYPGRYNPPRQYFYHSGLFWYGFQYNYPFFAFDTFCPTQWVYLGGNCWFQVGAGYYYQPPAIVEPITVSVEYVYSDWVWDDSVGGYVQVQETVVYFYNAFWDAAAGCYGYYDANGNYNLLSW